MKHASKKIIALLMAVAMIISVFPTVFAANVGPFTDVDTSEWFAEYVEYVYDNDLMNGMTATTFEPRENLTRAQTAMVLYRIAGEEEVGNEASFTDLQYDWYKKCIAWAEAEEIVNGIGEGLFDPDGHITREALVTMMHRFAGLPEAEADDLYKDFPDAADVSDWAKDAVNWALGEEIICGSEEFINGEKTIILNPLGNATRAEFSKIIAQFDRMQKSDDNECEEHTWDEGTVTKAATCTEAGEMTYTCTVCGETKTEEIPMTAHEYVDGVCKNCGDALANKDEIVIYYTNDTHTYVDKDLSFDSVADLKSQTKKVAAGVLLVDAGDHIQGTAYGSLDKGKAVMEMMCAAGYDVATLGNHEFDYGMERALEITKLGIPYVSANFYKEANGVKGDNVLDAYKIFEVGGKKIAIVGITTPESFTKSTPKYFQDENGNYIYGIAGGTDGAELYASVQTAIDAAKAAGADYIIALGHLGDDPSSKPWTSEELIANTTGLNAFIDGHSHSTVVGKSVKDKGGNTVILTQTGEYFDTIGKMTISASGAIATELMDTYTGKDATVKGIKDKWIADVDEKLGEVIGHADVTLDNYDAEGNRLVRRQETNTGDFAADALYYLFDVTEGLDVDLAIMNGGGVRNKAITGDISYKTCKDIHTFGNVACLITVTGQQILDALEFGAREVGATEDGVLKECGGFLQVSHVTYEIHTYIPNTIKTDDKGVWTAGPTEYRVKNVMIGGEPLDLTKTYNLAGYNYTLRDLGDGFAMFDGAVNVKDYVMEDYMVLANYVKSFAVGSTGVPTISKGGSYDDVNGDGRITIVNEKGGTVDPVVTNEYTLADSVSDGAKVVLYNPANGVALCANYGSFKNLAGVSVTPVGNVITTEDSSIIWTIVDNGDGSYGLKADSGLLGATSTTGSDGKTYYDFYVDGTGEDNAWVITPISGTDRFDIATKTLSSSYGPIFVEWYNGLFKGYSTSRDNTKFYSADAMGFQLYVLGGGSSGGDTTCTHVWNDGVVTTAATCTTDGEKTFTCTLCGATKTETIPATGHIDANGDGKCDSCGMEAGKTEGYVLSDSLSDGDKVVLYNPANGVALSSAYGSFKNLAGVSIAPTGESIVPTDDSIIWTIVDNGDGSYGLKADSGLLGATATTGSDGKTYYDFYVDGTGEDNAWVVTPISGTDRFDIATKTLTSTYGPVFIEWYNGLFKGYSTSRDNTKFYSADAMGFQLYVYGEACNHLWGAGVVTTAATCTTDGVMTYTCTACGATKTEPIPATGHTDANGDNKCDSCGADLSSPIVPPSIGWAPATALNVGDELIITATVDSGSYELTGFFSTKSANLGEATAFTDELAGSLTLTVEAGTDAGTYAFKTAEGKYLSWSSGNSLDAADSLNANSSWAVTFNDNGTAKIVNATTVSSSAEEQRVIVFNLNAKNNGSPRFATYAKYSGKESETAEYGIPVLYTNGTAAACEHTNTVDVAAVPATCTEAGKTAGVKCADCGKLLSGCTEIAALGHIDENGDDTCDRCGKDLAVAAGSFVLADSLNDGDEVIIYNAGSGNAVASVSKGTYYLDFVTIALESDAIATDDTSIIWTVGKNADGSYTFTSANGTLSMNVSTGSDGKTKTSLSLDGANPNMTVETCNAANKSFYLYSATLTGGYGNIYLEWYASFSDFSAYSTSVDRLSESAFGFQFFVR